MQGQLDLRLRLVDDKTEQVYRDTPLLNLCEEFDAGVRKRSDDRNRVTKVQLLLHTS